MKTLILFLFMCFSIILTAQDFGQVGAEWYYNGYDKGFGFLFDSTKGFQKITATKDTFYQGKNVRKFEFYTVNGMQNTVDSGTIAFCYQSNDTVYQFNHSSNTFKIKLIFNLNKRDTLKLFSFTGLSEIEYYVDTVYSVLTDGEMLKHYKLIKTQSPFDAERTLIDKIGIYEHFNLEDYGAISGFDTRNIRCYSDSLIDTNYFSFPCDYVEYTNIPENALSQKITLYPNPVTTTLTIQSHEIELQNVTILTLEGKELPTPIHNRNKLSVTELPCGIYFLKIETKQGTIVKNFIKE